jgi:Chemotaxis response regulator containing a CheY-like receiver domain and a methylesterase domain
MGQRKIKVFIVDDNREICGLLQDFLSIDSEIEAAGVANNGMIALDWTRKNYS